MPLSDEEQDRLDAVMMDKTSRPPDERVLVEYIRELLADNARLREQWEDAKREGWLRHAPGCNRLVGEKYKCRCGFEQALAQEEDGNEP